MLIGYARISKADGSQSLDLQRDALREAGVSDDAIYQDQASGQREDRPGLAAFLKAARAGRRDRRLEARSPRSQSPPSRQPEAFFYLIQEIIPLTLNALWLHHHRRSRRRHASS